MNIDNHIAQAKKKSKYFCNAKREHEIAHEELSQALENYKYKKAVLALAQEMFNNIDI